MVASQTKSLTEIAQQTRAAALKLAILSTDDRNSALEAVARALEAATPEIIAANEADLKAAESDNIAPHYILD